MKKEESKLNKSTASGAQSAEDDRALLNMLLHPEDDKPGSLFSDQAEHGLPLDKKDDFLDGDDLLTRLEDHGFGWLNAFEDDKTSSSAVPKQAEPQFVEPEISIEAPIELVKPYVEPVKQKPIIIDVQAEPAIFEEEKPKKEPIYQQEKIEEEIFAEPVYNKEEIVSSAPKHGYASRYAQAVEPEYVAIQPEQKQSAPQAQSFYDEEEDAPVTQHNLDHRADDFESSPFHKDEFSQYQRNNIIDDLNLPAEKPSLMSALLPYVAAIGFFTFIAGAAVFYFVATHEQDDRSGQLATLQAPSVPTAPIPASAPVSQGSKDQSSLGTESSGFELSTRFDDKPFGSSSPPAGTDTGPSGRMTEMQIPIGKSPAEPVFVPAEPASSASDAPARQDLSRQEPARQEVALVTPPRFATPERDLRSEAQAPVATRPMAASLAPQRAMQISATQEIEMLARGRETLRLGDVAGARLLFQYLADQGSANGAFAMGQTYDAALLSSLGVRGLKGDPKQARTWYEKAAALGSKDAAAKIRDQ